MSIERPNPNNVGRIALFHFDGARLHFDSRIVGCTDTYYVIKVPKLLLKHQFSVPPQTLAELKLGWHVIKHMPICEQRIVTLAFARRIVRFMD